MNKPEQLRISKIQRIDRLRTLIADNEIFLAELRGHREQFEKLLTPTQSPRGTWSRSAPDRARCTMAV